jgi:septum site-determining protein MinC
MHAGEEEAGELFGTETMAELCARQGRLEDARTIYRRLCARGGEDHERLARWSARLRALETQVPVPMAGAGATGARSAAARPPAAAAPPVAPARSGHALPLVVREPVRAGQVVYAEGNDLIVLAPVNPGAQLLADGNIHVYAPLRGRAVAGVRGARQARIFCQRLEAELVGIDAAYLTADDLAPERVGKPAQIALDGDRCVVAPL